MSKVVPQKPDLNRILWRLLEREVFTEWLPKFEDLWVINGPVYERSLGTLKSGVSIPSGFFKVIADITDEEEMRVLSFLVPLDASDFDRVLEYLSSIDDIEMASGLDLYSGLEDAIEAELEALESRRMW